MFMIPVDVGSTGEPTMLGVDTAMVDAGETVIKSEAAMLAPLTLAMKLCEVPLLKYSPAASPLALMLRTSASVGIRVLGGSMLVKVPL